jgi:hypothetical protein
MNRRQLLTELSELNTNCGQALTELARGDRAIAALKNLKKSGGSDWLPPGEGMVPALRKNIPQFRKQYSKFWGAPISEKEAVGEVSARRRDVARSLKGIRETGLGHSFAELNNQLTQFWEKPWEQPKPQEDSTGTKIAKLGATAAVAGAGIYGAAKGHEAIMKRAAPPEAPYTGDMPFTKNFFKPAEGGPTVGQAYQKAGTDAVNAVKTKAADLGSRAATYVGGAYDALNKAYTRGTAKGMNAGSLLGRLAKAGIGYVKSTKLDTREALTELQVSLTEFGAFVPEGQKPEETYDPRKDFYSNRNQNKRALLVGAPLAIGAGILAARSGGPKKLYKKFKHQSVFDIAKSNSSPAETVKKAASVI